MARRPVLWLLALLLAVGGCRSRSDLVEAELRTKDRQLREVQGELLRAETMNEALENTLRDNRSGCPTPARANPMGLVQDIQLGRGTGGIDEDKCPGDEGIQVVLVPRDADGSAIKVPGLLRVTALEVTPQGIKVPLSTWDVSANKLRQSWRSGLLSTGYHVNLNWQVLPHAEKLRIVAQFQPLEGGAFEAEKDVSVRLGDEVKQRGGQVPAGPIEMAPPRPTSPTPLPATGPIPLGPPTPIEPPVLPPPENVHPTGPHIPAAQPTALRKPSAVQLMLPVPTAQKSGD